MLKKNSEIISALIALTGILISCGISWWIAGKNNETAIIATYLNNNIVSRYEREKDIFEKKILEFSDLYVNKNHNVDLNTIYLDNGEYALKEMEKLANKIGKNCAMIFAFGGEKEAVLAKNISNSYLEIYSSMLKIASQLLVEKNNEKRKKIISDFIHDYHEFRKSISRDIGSLELEIRKGVDEFKNRQYLKELKTE